MAKYKIGIIGDGYTAADLLRLMAGHDEIEPVCIFSVDNIGKRIDEVYPSLAHFSSLVCEPTDLGTIKKKCDAVFLALPHGLSVPIVSELAAAGIKCIDLGADFRLKDARVYAAYYDKEHENPYLLNKAVYGIPELNREKIKNADIIANPGCFPTSAIIPLSPLLKAGVVESENIIIDSKTGVSGAGRSLKLASMFCEVNEGVKAYSVGRHRHMPEIAQELSLAAGKEVDLVFTPHLVPMSRGILSTIYVRLKPGVKGKEIREVLEEQYENEFFVRLLPNGLMPQTRWVYGSNFIDIGIYSDENRGKAILVSAIDNLVKGASGQALQNLNLVLRLEEGKGLKNLAPLFP
ncbi:N-acetyl-gamma-glutamyl-phosphate reductase [Thermosyntropha sp.]|uniref:N-acetyl-gamma-glutamyl-phosphate reductase n=1 Tax=Thermosyntropha sp. TaxID=2740820 RepID=UPI0025DB4535|nr:N-acetyl-gamma-glutamyl-phosphate reductase [Thermosyntropha sp.]MBO8158083.1 N-acetyl-gamma-glutamyl-phosphate reductase [Thermosyntropha sp.]